MKFTIASTGLLGAIMAGSTSAIISDKPYQLLFFYNGTRTNTTNMTCDSTFKSISDSVYQEYVHELVFTTSAIYSDVDKADPRWFKVAGFYEPKSKFPDMYRTDMNIWGGGDRFDVNGKYDLDIEYNDPTKQDSGAPPDVAARAAYAQPYVAPALDIDDTPRLNDDRRSRQLRGAGSTGPITEEQELRKLLAGSECGLAIAVGRPQYGNCTVTASYAKGNKTNILTEERGAAIAELFYENVDIYLKENACKDIINDMIYAVVDLKL